MEERGGEEPSGGHLKGNWGMSIRDSDLFPEVQAVGLDERRSKEPSTFGSDPDRVLGGNSSGGELAPARPPARSSLPAHEHMEAEECRRVAPLGRPVCSRFMTRSGGEEDASMSLLTNPVANMSAQGTGQYKNLQDLLIGFSTGALSVVANEHGNLFSINSEFRRNVQFQTCEPALKEIASEQLKSSHGIVYEMTDDQCTLETYEADSNAGQMSIEAYDSADNDPTDDQVDRSIHYLGSARDIGAGSDADNEETDIEVLESGRTDAPIVVEGHEGSLDMVDWERFYATGELLEKNESISNNEHTGNPDGIEEAPSTETTGTWKKRRRDKVIRDRKQFRMPRGMGAVERAMRQSCENNGGLVFEPRIGLEFDSEGEAFEFYNLYSWELGFGIRKGNSDGNKSGFTTVRDIVCVKQGYDKRAKVTTKRCHCKAMIRLHRTEDDGWFISSFVKEHNHELSATDEEKKEWQCHRDIQQSARDMIKNLRDHNVQLSKIQCILGSMYGSMDNIPFTRRSLKIICAQIAREQRDDDMKKTLAVFRQMRSEDPGFQFSVELDKYNQTKTLIWATGRSRSQYSCFGDVVTFDTTYCTNIYKMPFGLFVGVNNHFQTTIFAGVLMTDETAESFNWVFTEFLTLMGGVHPQTILTDQCKAMEIALQEVMPGTTHLWCRWHVFKDARIELGPVFRKNNEFHDEFHRVISEMYTIEEFEHHWDALLVRYKLKTHHFMVRAYDKRKKWAKCYNSGTFCARMTSTQRSESANHMLKTWVPRNSSMNRFVSDLNKLLYSMYAEEERAEHVTKQDVRVNKIQWDVEKHAMKIYTKKVFAMFSAEMQKIRRYGVPQTNDNEVFIVTHTNAEYVQRYRRAEFRVVSVNKGEKYQCVCGLYEHFGLLCCHILRVFIHIGVSEIPEAHIMKRWTRKAKDLIPENLRMKCVSSSEEHAKMHIQSQIYGKAMEVARKGKYDFETRDIVMKYLQKAERKVDEYIRKRDEEAKGKEVEKGSSSQDQSGYCTSSDNDIVSENRFGASGSCAGMSDEEVMNIKAPVRPRKGGAPRKKRFLSFLDKIDSKTRNKNKNNPDNKSSTKPKAARRRKKDQTSSTKVTPHCTICRLPGHNRTRCPNYAPPPVEEPSD